MWYVITPDGSAWTAVQIDDAGMMVSMIEEANAENHIAANDRYSRICEAIANGEVSESVNLELAANVVQAWDVAGDPTACCVERINA